MKFGEALEGMKQGKKAVRKGWWDRGVFSTIEKVEGFTNPVIVMYRREEKFPLDLSSDSIMAEDWGFIED